VGEREKMRVSHLRLGRKRGNNLVHWRKASRWWRSKEDGYYLRHRRTGKRKALLTLYSLSTKNAHSALMEVVCRGNSIRWGIGWKGGGKRKVIDQVAWDKRSLWSELIVSY